MYMNNYKICFLLGLALVSNMACAKKAFEDVPYEVIDTGLVQQESYPSNAVWLSNERLIINTHEIKKYENGQWYKKDGAVLFDVKNGNKKQIVIDGMVGIFDADSQLACIALQ